MKEKKQAEKGAELGSWSPETEGLVYLEVADVVNYLSQTWAGMILIPPCLFEPYKSTEISSSAEQTF